MRHWLWAAVILVGGCGGSAPEPKTESSSGADPEEAAPSRGPSLELQSEIGALDQKKVEQTMQRVSPKLSSCFSKGAQRVPYLSGSVSFKVRVAEDGSVRWAYLTDSSIGDLETEQCMISALKSASWPKPVGGEGLAGNDNIAFEPGGDERPPVEWSPDRLGDAYKKLRPQLADCRKSAGTGPVKVTLYVETDGKPKAIGASTADEKGEAAVQCIVDALRSAKFPSPGSYASKVSVVVD